jgi:hypothetical protein
VASAGGRPLLVVSIGSRQRFLQEDGRMHTANSDNKGWVRRLGSLALVIAALALLSGCAQEERIEPKAFASAQDAVDTLVQAMRTHDMEQLKAIVGSEGTELVESGDEVADQQNRQEFLRLYDEKHGLTTNGDGSVTLCLGNLDWPFPLPLVANGQNWAFDVASGKEEVINRRVGRNELSAVQVCQAIADAQREYALRDPNNDGVHEYAQRFWSEPNKRNGLYWPTAEGEQPSPLGELAAEASEEGYTRDPNASGPRPYHGYCYRILKSQGPSAAAGALDYVVKGKMILGFAVVAYPAEYDNSGVMTFIINQDGVVYQKDLGEKTEKLAREMTAFDPGEGWQKVE